nr:hypothetical protein [Tanacetum cinerariifolium]
TQLWTLVKETLSIRQSTSDKEKELWVELKRLHEPDVEDQLWTHTQALMHDSVHKERFPLLNERDAPVEEVCTADEVKTSVEVSQEDLKAMMQLVPAEEVYVEALQVKHQIINWEIHTEGHRNYWKIIRLGGHTAVYQFFVDMLNYFDREDLTQLWTLVKETLSIRQSTSDKEKELWVELKRLHEPDVEDQLWTHTQALMHDPVQWRLYDTCGVHYVLTRD